MQRTSLKEQQHHIAKRDVIPDDIWKHILDFADSQLKAEHRILGSEERLPFLKNIRLVNKSFKNFAARCCLIKWKCTKSEDYVPNIASCCDKMEFTMYAHQKCVEKEIVHLVKSRSLQVICFDGIENAEHLSRIMTILPKMATKGLKDISFSSDRVFWPTLKQDVLSNFKKLEKLECFSTYLPSSADSLKVLEITDVCNLPNLEERLKKNITKPRYFDCSKYPNLTQLTINIHICDQVSQLARYKLPKSLKFLEVPKLVNIHNLKELTSLEQLFLTKCTTATDLKDLPSSLTNLSITNTVYIEEILDVEVSIGNVEYERTKIYDDKKIVDFAKICPNLKHLNLASPIEFLPPPLLESLYFDVVEYPKDIALLEKLATEAKVKHLGIGCVIFEDDNFESDLETIKLETKEGILDKVEVLYFETYPPRIAFNVSSQTKMITGEGKRFKERNYYKAKYFSLLGINYVVAETPEGIF